LFGDGRVGLEGLAPDASDRAEDSDRQVGPLVLERSAHGDAPLADAHFRLGHHLGHRKRTVDVDFQEHDLAIVVAGHEPGRLPRAVGQPHEDRLRLVHEIERAGNDVALRINDQSARRAGAHQEPLDAFHAADGLDADDRRRNPGHRRRDGLLFQRVEIVARSGRGNRRHQQQDCEGFHHVIALYQPLAASQCPAKPPC
jgi:hypothetical protein